MNGQTTTDNTPSIWKWENTAHITKAGMEAAFATASLSTAIVAILILTGTIAAPLAIFGMVANFAGIAILGFAFLYFAAQAVSSYQQMKANLLIEDAIATVEAEADKVDFDAKAQAAADKVDFDAKAQAAADKVNFDGKAQAAVETEAAKVNFDGKAQAAVETEAAKVKFDEKAKTAVDTEAAKVNFDEKAKTAVDTVVKGHKLVTETELTDELAKKANAEDLTKLTDCVNAKLNKADLDTEMKTVLETSESEVTKHLGSKYAPIAPTHV